MQLLFVQSIILSTKLYHEVNGVFNTLSDSKATYTIVLVYLSGRSIQKPRRRDENAKRKNHEKLSKIRTVLTNEAERMCRKWERNPKRTAMVRRRILTFVRLAIEDKMDYNWQCSCLFAIETEVGDLYYNLSGRFSFTQRTKNSS